MPWSPKLGFAVTFVDGVPAEARELVTGLSYDVALHGDGQASEASLAQLRNRIWHLLNEQGVTRESTGVDPVRGIVEIVVPPGFEPESDILRGLLEDPESNSPSKTSPTTRTKWCAAAREPFACRAVSSSLSAPRDSR